MPAASTFEVYRRYYGFVRHALLRNNVAEADVDDAVHEVFIVLLRKLGPDVGREDMRSWLFEVSRRIASNRRRAARRHERKRRIAMPGRQLPCPDEQLARREAAEQLAEFLASLRPDDRVVFVLAEVEGAPGRVIAERLGIKLHLAYARMRVVRRSFEQRFGVQPRRHGRLRSIFMLPSRLAGPRCAPLWPAAMLALAVAHAPAQAVTTAPTTHRDAEGLAPTAAVRAWSEPNDAVAAAVPRERDDATAAVRSAARSQPDLIEVLPDHGPRARSTRRASDPFARALTAALLPDHAVSRQRKTPTVAPRARDSVAPGDATPEADRPAAFELTRVRLPRRAGAGVVGPRRPAVSAPALVAWSGRFVDEDGQPLAGARVLCRRRTPAGLRRRCLDRASAPRTDADGAVTLQLAPGRYELLALPAGATRSAAVPTIVTVASKR